MIDVDSSKPCLVVPRGVKAKYVALSHCWGGRISNLLTTKTLATFQVALPYSSLPANFRDAIAIAKELGIKYLWIDSLCILQDSKSDWASESKKMGNIYRNATITISAEASTGSTAGILRRASGQASPLGSVLLRISSEEDAKVSAERRHFYEEDLRSLDIDSPLSRRGWVLQEAILSSRILYYGNKSIFWKCRSGVEAANGVPAGAATPSYRYLEVSAVIHQDDRQTSGCKVDSVVEVLEDYYKIVSAYSHRQLTFGSDKLVAFSGLSQLLQPTIDSSYLAGIWSGDINHGLLWYQDTESCKHVQPYRAPTWSWAVTDEPIIMATPDREPSELDMRLLEYKVVPRDSSNTFGEMIFAQITVDGFTMPLIRSKQMVEFLHPEDTIGNCFFDEQGQEGREEMGFADTYTSIIPVSSPNDGGDEFLLSVKTRHGQEEDWTIEHNSFSPVTYVALFVKVDVPHSQEALWAHGLVLREVSVDSSSNNTFERVGYFRIDYKYAWNLAPRLEENKRLIITLI